MPDWLFEQVPWKTIEPMTWLDQALFMSSLWLIVVLFMLFIVGFIGQNVKVIRYCSITLLLTPFALVLLPIAMTCSVVVLFAMVAYGIYTAWRNPNAIQRW